MRVPLQLIGLALIVGSLLDVKLAASEDHLDFPPKDEAEHSPAYHYANLTNDDAFAELDRRHVPYERVPGDVPGVRAAIRLRGPLHGVTIHSALAEAKRTDSVFEILDARLALALDDWARILKNHDIVEVIHFSMYRPPGAHAAQTEQFRHPGGLAIDVGALRKKNGELLSISPSWSSSIGSTTCGPDARKLKPRRGRELQSIVCEAADQRLFQCMLTPHFNKRHKDHVHLEIKPGVKWFMVD